MTVRDSSLNEGSLQTTQEDFFLLRHQKGFPILKGKHLYHISEWKGSWKGYHSMYWVRPFAAAKRVPPEGEEGPKP